MMSKLPHLGVGGLLGELGLVRGVLGALLGGGVLLRNVGLVRGVRGALLRLLLRVVDVLLLLLQVHVVLHRCLLLRRRKHGLHRRRVHGVPRAHGGRDWRHHARSGRGHRGLGGHLRRHRCDGRPSGHRAHRRRRRDPKPAADVRVVVHPMLLRGRLCKKGKGGKVERE